MIFCSRTIPESLFVILTGVFTAQGTENCIPSKRVLGLNGTFTNITHNLGNYFYQRDRGTETKIRISGGAKTDNSAWCAGTEGSFRERFRFFVLSGHVLRDAFVCRDCTVNKALDVMHAKYCVFSFRVF